MSIKERIKQAKAQGFIVYANIGNNTDELIVCTADAADNAGAIIVNIYYVEHSAFCRTMIITAEVK